MPLVVVTRNRNDIPDRSLVPLGLQLQKIVATVLSCEDPGGTLTTDDIEIRFREVGTFDINSGNFLIEVFANDYPDRRANLQERTERIAAALKAYNHKAKILKPELFDGKNFVWVMLAPAGFSRL